jgi:hypothetical protein
MAIRSVLSGRAFLMIAFIALIARVSQAESVRVAWNSNPEPDIAGYKLFWGQLNSAATVRDVGNTNQAEVTDLTPGTTYYLYLTAYNTSGLESDPSSSITYTVPSGPPPISVQTEAAFVRTDAITSGSWKGAYGLQGGLTANVWGVVPLPAHVQVRAYQNYPLMWSESTTDLRALQGHNSNRFATAWHGTNSVYFYLNFKDTKVHQVSFYFVDFDRQGREQLIEVFDNDTGQFLGTETISDFEDGRYSIWNLRGNVRIKLTRLAGPDCVMSAIFFDPQPTAFASYLGVDATTSGSWRGIYGTEGGLTTPWNLVPPSYVQLSAYLNYPLLWSDPTSDLRALQKPSGGDRFAGAWNSTNNIYFYLKFRDSASHEVAFYFVDYDRAGRQQKLEIFDQGTGNLLHSTIISGFGNGVYHRYNLSGNIRLTLTRIAGPTCVLSGIFFDPPQNGANFLAADSQTSGTWKGVYGSAGNNIATEQPQLPPGVAIDLSEASAVTWAANTTDTSALQRSTTSGRVASAWSAPRQYTSTITLSDSSARNLSLYFVDFDNKNRKQIVELLDATTGVALDRTELTGFRSGTWLTYNIEGAVSIRITSLTGASAVLSGMFFD